MNLGKPAPQESKRHNNANDDDDGGNCHGHSINHHRYHGEDNDYDDIDNLSATATPTVTRP